MCSSPGSITRASSTIVRTWPAQVSRLVAIRASSVPVQARKNASPAMSRTISTTVRTTSVVIALPPRGRRRRRRDARVDPPEEQVVLQALGEHEVDPVSGLRDQRGVRGVARDRLQRVAHLDDLGVDPLDEHDQQAQQHDDRHDHDGARARGSPSSRSAPRRCSTVSLPTARGRAATRR